MPNKHCLVVDDSDAIRRVTKSMLTALGLHASDAVNGEDALERCRQAMPDAIVLDWIMPVLSGPECLQSLRRLPGGKQPAIIYCTTVNDPAEIARALEAGADDVLVKPYDRDALRQKLASLGVI